MRKIVFLLAFFLIAPAVHAQETIRAFDVQAELTADRRLTVTETIRYDFGEQERHGIFRFIPETYERDGSRYKLRLQVVDVRVDGKQGEYVTSWENGNLRIKIGDPDRTITGAHTYAITYQTDKAVNDFDDHRELYWNVTGNAWGVSIEGATFVLRGPAAPTQMRCYAGHLGSQSEECVIVSDGTVVRSEASRMLGPGEGLTVVIGFPLDVIRGLTAGERLRQFVIDNFWVFWPLLVFLVMFAIWWKWGKEPRGRGTVIAQYEEPRGLRPALLSTLMEQRVSQRALTATLLDLARRGYMSFRFWEMKGRLKKSSMITLVKGKVLSKDAPPFEWSLWDGLFGSAEEVEVEDLKGAYFKSIEQARKQIFDDLRERKLFGKNPSAVRAIWIGIAIAVVFVSFWFIVMFGGLFMISAFASGVIIILFGWQMPRMTKEGAIVREEAEGFKKFLSVTEKARLDFTDAPERTPAQFERFLPAAVAFGVEEKWAGQFAGMDMQPPSYVEGYAGAWSAAAFAQAIGTVHEASAASLYTAPASTAGGGGSGFSGGGSGGGYGGGGGGSW